MIKNIFSPIYRKFFGFIKDISSFNLLGVVINSYNNFFKNNYSNISHGDVNKNDLKSIFNEIFPVKNLNHNLLINFIDFKLCKPNNSYNYCIKNGLTYSSELKAKFCISPLNYKYIDNFSNCQYINIATIPLITDKASFIINGVEKAIVSKFTRAPGIYLLNSLKNQKKIFLIKIIPNKGLDFKFIINDNNFLILKILNHEISLIYLLRYTGLSLLDIIDNFYNSQYIYIINNIFFLKFSYKYFLNIIIPFDILNNENEVLIPKNTLINENYLNKIKESNIKFIKILDYYLIGRFLSKNIYINNFLLFLVCGKIDYLFLFKFKCFKIKNIDIIYFSTNPHSSVLLSIVNSEVNIFVIKNIVENFFKKIGFIFFKKNFYNFSFSFNQKNIFDISGIRKKINFKLNKKGFFGPNYFTSNDILKIIKTLILFKDGLYSSDDMQNLNSMKLNLVGEMLYEIFRKNILILKKIFFERKIYSKKFFLPKDFLNFNILDIEIKKFFNLSRYSQFLDQTNILSELSHKRRVSFFGMPGVSAEHSGFDVRDLNYSYYSKLCPVESPEGINIGLVNSLSLFALVNKDGELISPYYKVINSKIITKSIKYLSTWQESNLIFSDTYKKVTPNNYIIKSLINARCNNQFIITKSNSIKYIDVFSFQILSVCASLIPFIEYNDSNRALMASNMLKQALPCIYPQRPIVGTGMEYFVGTNGSDIIKSKDFGIVKYIDSSFLILEKLYKNKNYLFHDYDIYSLSESISSNQNTFINQRFIVDLNDNISCGQVLNDNSCTDNGELSIGQNMVVAFMSWGGYNFEDSLIVSQKVISEDRFTSLESFNLDISFYSDDNFIDISDYINLDFTEFSKLNKLDKFGIIKVGSLVYSGDIIVKKKTFSIKNKNSISNEMKLINMIIKDNFFEEKNIKDSSFFLPNNFNLAIVNNVEVFFSKNIDLTDFDKDLLNYQSSIFLKNKKNIFMYFFKKIKYMIKNFFINKEIYYNDKVILCSNSFLFNKSVKEMLCFSLKDKDIDIFFKKFSLKLKKYIKIYNIMCKNIKNRFMKILPINVSKIIKIHFLRKKKLQVGDKMSGRHGNKGVVSKIVPVNEMPYMSNGVPVDVILNPLGVPSRMNVGQLLEVHLGFISLLIGFKIKKILSLKKIKVLRDFLYNIYNILDDKIAFDIRSYSSQDLLFIAKKLSNGFYFGIPGFSSIDEKIINDLLLYLSSKFKNFEFSDTNKQIYLYDGKTGKKFDNPITVGIMYILKLNHLSEDKIHSRSVGPYSLVTQQPLKGKSNMGGQRLGEMEVWALEAYGASNTLKDMLTIKSDDMQGRIDAYKGIIKNSYNIKYNKPESLDVVINNINSLGLYCRFVE